MDIEVVQDAIIKNGSVIETNVGKDVLKGLGSGGVRVKAESIEILGVFDSDAEVIAPTTIQSSVAKDSMGGPSGNIELEARSILLKDFGSLETLTEGIGDAGNILLKANNNIDMVFGSVFSGSINATGNAGNIELLSTNGNILASSTIILSQATATDGNAGSIAVKAPRGDILLGDASEVSNLTFRGGTLQGIQIESNNLTLSDNSIIAGNNFSTVTPGNISISLPGHLSLSGDSHIETVARGSARAADLTITANNISLTDASFLSTESRSSGNGGQLSIVTETLQLTSGGQIRSPSTIGIDPVRGTPVVPSGAGGTVNIHALGNSTSTVMIDGAGSGIFTNTVGTGTAGNTYIAAQTLTVQNGGTISAATSGISSSATGGAITVNANQVNLMNGGLITAASTGMGAGGSIVINSTNSLSSNAGVISTTASQATGGSIAITASQMVNLTNGATISASSTGPGNAGNIFINAGQQLNMQKGSITTEAAQAAGGNIDIRAVDIVNLQGSAVSTSVLGGTGSGGNITIDPNTVLLQNSQILANAVQGNGGNISITTNLLLPDATSLIKASSEFGQNGTIMIQSPISPASGKIIPLSQRPLTAATLLSQRCAVFAASGEMSSFTVAGRDRLPIEPGTWLASPTMFNPITPSFLTLEYSGHDDSIGDSPILALRQIAPAGFLSQAFAPDPSVECG
ncbi:hypothetical protein W02_02580 [Nitrospira sp. KM1]|nr:hypothetical protein W02_02580 [Nitrospira sp. KM1]